MTSNADFKQLLTQFSTFLHTDNNPALAFETLGALMSEISAVLDDTKVQRIKHVLYQLQESPLSNAEIARLLDTSIPLPKEPEIPAPIITEPVQTMRISFQELLKSSKTRVHQLPEPIVTDTFSVVGGKFAHSHSPDMTGHKLLLSVVIEENGKRKLRTLRGFDDEMTSKILESLREILGSFIIKR
jgi:hypothetical protein